MASSTAIVPLTIQWNVNHCATAITVMSICKCTVECLLLLLTSAGNVTVKQKSPLFLIVIRIVLVLVLIVVIVAVVIVVAIGVAKVVVVNVFCHQHRYCQPEIVAQKMSSDANSMVNCCHRSHFH